MFNRRVKLVIAIPSGDTWHANFGMSLAMMLAELMSRPLPGTQGQNVTIQNTKGSLLPKSREVLIENALKMKADYILFIDSDMIFPRYLVHELFKHGKAVVACNCATKQIPAQPTARSRNDDKGGGDKFYTDPESHGLAKVWRVGTGVMLINTSVFNRVKPPMFEVRWNGKHYVGEDWRFCEKLEEAGIDIWIDHDMSKEIGHEGMITFDHSIVGEVVRHEDHEVQTSQARCEARGLDGGAVLEVSGGGLPRSVYQDEPRNNQGPIGG